MLLEVQKPIGPDTAGRCA